MDSGRKVVKDRASIVETWLEVNETGSPAIIFTRTLYIEQCKSSLENCELRNDVDLYNKHAYIIDLGLYIGSTCEHQCMR